MTALKVLADCPASSAMPIEEGIGLVIQGPRYSYPITSGNHLTIFQAEIFTVDYCTALKMAMRGPNIKSCPGPEES